MTRKTIAAAALAVSALVVLAGPPARITTRFGRVSPSNTVEYAPMVINLGNVVDGVAYPYSVRTAHGTTNQYASLGWLPTDVARPERSGYIASQSGMWCVSNNVVTPVWRWDAVPRAVHTYSKLKVLMALQDVGAWPAAKAWIETNGLYDAYVACQVFTDDNPLYLEGLSELKKLVGLTDGQIAELLRACEIEAR